MPNATNDDDDGLYGWGHRLTVVDYLLMTFGVLISVGGTLGNVVIIALKTRPVTRDSADAAYKVTLAVADTLSLYSGHLDLMVYVTTNHVLIDKSLGACNAVLFFSNVFALTATWILVALNVERCYSVIYPLRGRRSWQMAVAVSAGSLVFFCALMSPVFVFHEMVAHGEYYVCREKDEYERASNILMSVCLVFFNFFMPLILFLTTHIIILLAMKKRNLTIGRSVACRQTETATSTATMTATLTATLMATLTPNVTSNVTSNLLVSQRSASIVELPTAFTRRASVIERRSKTRTFHFLLVLDLAFFVFVFPRSLASMIEGAYETFVFKIKSNMSRDVYVVLGLLYYMQNSCNFVFYAALSRSFRQECRKLLWPQRAAPVYLNTRRPTLSRSLSSSHMCKAPAASGPSDEPSRPPGGAAPHLKGVALVPGEDRRERKSLEGTGGETVVGVSADVSESNPDSAGVFTPKESLGLQQKGDAADGGAGGGKLGKNTRDSEADSEKS